MATYTIVPNEDHTPDSGDWDIQSGQGSDIYAILDGAGNYIYQGTTGKDFRVGFTTHALSDGETIDSIQACFTAHTANTRTETAVVRIDIENASNTQYFTDNHTITVNGGSPATYCSDVETTSDGGSTAWTQSNIDDIRMMGEITSFSGGAPTVVMYQAYITVVTTIAPQAKVLTINAPLTVNGKLIIK